MSRSSRWIRALGVAVVGLGAASTLTALSAPDGPAPTPAPAPPGPGALDAPPRYNPPHSPGLVKWHPTIEAARAASAKSGKPVFHVQIVGRMDERYCCTNTRIARAILFSDADIAKQINDSTEPVWESLRPAILMTVDYGDGRRVTRSLRGNLATLLTLADGTVVDALPGLYQPKVYAEQLGWIVEAATWIAVNPAGGRAAALAGYHRGRLAELGPVPLPPGLAALAAAGGGFTKGGGAFEQGPAAERAGLGGGALGFGGLPAPPPNPLPFGIEGRLEWAILEAALPDGGGAAGPADLARFAEREDLRLDTEANELVRRRDIHNYLAANSPQTVAAFSPWLYAEVLKVRLTHATLGVSDLLGAGYPFLD